VIYLAQLDERQPVDAAVTSLAAAQGVVERLAQQYRALPADVHWENLGAYGYPNCWAYVGGGIYGDREHYGSVQVIEVTDSGPETDLTQSGAIPLRQE
jgi:hypothetical protein